jgi:enoyl-CoA hydratase
MPTVSLDRDGAVALVRFTNPPDGFMNTGTESEYAAVLDVIENDPAIRAVVLTGGQPGVFIRHYSVAELEQRARQMRARGLRFDTARAVPESRLHICFRRMETMPKPFVAAINGTAMGGGFELALCCDIRIAEDGPYSLGLPEINLGILPGAGGTQRLARLIGEARALELTLLGRTVSPAEAATLGMVSECCKGAVLPRALEIARELAGKSPRALGHIKRLVRGAHATDRAQGLADERTLFCDLMVDERAITLMGEWVAGKRDIRDR